MLRSVRLNKGLSVRALADEVRVNPASVYYWERRHTPPRDPAVAKRIADFFGVKVTDLWPVKGESYDEFRRRIVEESDRRVGDRRAA